MEEKQSRKTRLFFTEGTVATPEEKKQAKAFGATGYRNAAYCDKDTAPEGDCIAAAGMVPEQYLKAKAITVVTMVPKSEPIPDATGDQGGADAPPKAPVVKLPK